MVKGVVWSTLFGYLETGVSPLLMYRIVKLEISRFS
jgi:hypothetical protein